MYYFMLGYLYVKAFLQLFFVCWVSELIRTGSLSAPDVNSTDNNQPPRKACYGILTSVHPHLLGLTLNQYWLLVKRKSRKVRMDPGPDPTAGLQG